MSTLLSSRSSLSVLILEDETMIAIDIEETLKEAGYTAFFTCSTRHEAGSWLASNTPDIALVDPNLRDGHCGEVITTLVERNVPFVVYSGNTDQHLGDPLSGRPWLMKPCSPDDLLAALDELQRQTKGTTP